MEWTLEIMCVCVDLAQTQLNENSWATTIHVGSACMYTHTVECNWETSYLISPSHLFTGNPSPAGALVLMYRETLCMWHEISEDAYGVVR